MLCNKHRIKQRLKPYRCFWYHHTNLNILCVQVSKVNLVMGVVGFTAVWLAIGYGSPFLCDFIGFVFPAYLSFKAVESPDTRDDTQWLTYWIVYRYAVKHKDISCPENTHLKTCHLH